MSNQISARIAGGILYAVILFQLALVAGAPWGEYTQGGQDTGTLSIGGRIIAMFSAGVLFMMGSALLALIRKGPFKDMRREIIHKFAFITVAYSGIGVIMNFASKSDGERMVWGPITLIGFLFSLHAYRSTRD